MSRHAYYYDPHTGARVQLWRPRSHLWSTARVIVLGTTTALVCGLLAAVDGALWLAHRVTP